MAPADFAAKMAELSAAFTQRTAADADEFEAVALALSRGDDGSQRARLEEMAHRLAGGSAIFGLVALQVPASELESSILAKASTDDICARSRELAQTIRRICGASAPGEGHDGGRA